MSLASAIQNSIANRGRPVPASISFVVDSSGSMDPYVDTVKQSVCLFLEEQQKVRGVASLMLAHFNDDFTKVIDHAPIKNIKCSTFNNEYRTTGGTALIDAIFKSIHDMENNLISKKPDPQEKIVMAFMTDGEENMSKKSAKDLSALIREKINAGWNFMLLGADKKTLEVADEYGIARDCTAVYSIENPKAAIQLLSDKLKEVRRGKELLITSGERQALLCSGTWEQCKLKTEL